MCASYSRVFVEAPSRFVADGDLRDERQAFYFRATFSLSAALLADVKFLSYITMRAR